VILISNIVLDVLDGSTIASTNIYSTEGTEDKKTYVNIGSGNVFNLKWTTTLTGGDTVNYYNLVIRRYDPTLNVYYDILNKNIGLVSKFSVNSDILPAAPEQYVLHVYVVAHSKNGVVVTSNIVTPYICKGGGTYVKTPAGPLQRAMSFVNAPTTTGPMIAILHDVTGQELQILDNEGNPVPFEVEATRILASNTWNIAQENYVKGDDGSWCQTDIKYDLLLDSLGGIITDSNNQPIYVL
jgi:hypothetical protein